MERGKGVGGREAAVISTLTSVFGKALESSAESSRVGILSGVRGRGVGGGDLRPRILLPAAVNIYACVLFIYIVKTNFAQGFNCFSLLCRNPPSLGPTPLLLVSDTHAKGAPRHGEGGGGKVLFVFN